MKQKASNSYARISFSEREELSRYLALGLGTREIARKLQRDHGALSREINNGGGQKDYRAHLAERRSRKKRKRQGCKRKLETNSKLRKYVLEKLTLFWSPEQIANSLKINYSKDTSMRISPETIYSYVYIQPKGELKKMLTHQLRRSHRRRFKRKGSRTREIMNINNAASIEKRPEEVRDRTIAGHWEGDLIIGKLRAGIGYHRRKNFTQSNSRAA